MIKSTYIYNTDVFKNKNHDTMSKIPKSKRNKNVFTCCFELQGGAI